MARALRDVNLDGSTLKNVINPVEMVPMELTACISAVETVRIMTLVTGETEHALVVLLDGKINIVTKLVMLGGTVQTVWKHVGVVWRLTIVPLLTVVVLVAAWTDPQELLVMNEYKVYLKNLNHRVLQSSPLLWSSLLC